MRNATLSRSVTPTVYFLSLVLFLFSLSRCATLSIVRRATGPYRRRDSQKRSSPKFRSNWQVGCGCMKLRRLSHPMLIGFERRRVIVDDKWHHRLHHFLLMMCHRRTIRRVYRHRHPVEIGDNMWWIYIYLWLISLLTIFTCGSFRYWPYVQVIYLLSQVSDVFLFISSDLCAFIRFLWTNTQ